MTDLDLIKFLIEKTENELSIIEKGIADLKKREQSQQEYLRKLHKQKRSALEDTDYPELSDAVVNKFSSETEKIKLFRSLFRGREDVFPRRFESKRTGRKGYQPVCKNEWIEGICMKPGIKCADCSNRDYIPITDNAIRSHLSGKDHITYRYGDFVMGVYPLLKDDTCYFLAIDFDKSTWKDDVRSYLETCETFNVPASLERSRSGNGGHIWIFFPKPVPAVLARKMGSFMLTQSMELRPEIGLDSYDRLFPNQDTMPKGGFGNLIALPLQKIPRIMGNSVFVDSNFDPYPDQWAYLSNLRKMLPVEVEKIVEEGVHQGKILGVRAVITDDKDENPWTAPPSGRVFQERIEGKLPIVVDIVLGNQIYINKTELPPGLRNQLIRIASFQNPEFYRAQARRQSIYNKPRIISCAEDFTKHIGLPRGCLTDVQDVFTSLGIKINLIDERYSGVPVDIAFQGDLTAEQEKAADICMKTEFGVISAATAFGKTVLGIYLLTARKTNTLILVHRKQLLDQWLEQLKKFTDLSESEIGFMGGGKRKLTGIVDVALIQSIYRKSTVDNIVADYGHLIVDECHHASARSYEMVIRQSKAKYITGLTATVIRKDGHHPITLMQCGPIRYSFGDRKSADKRPFNHIVIVHKTDFRLPLDLNIDEDFHIHDVFSALIGDESRNRLIVRDVLMSIQEGRSPVIMTERREHLDHLAQTLGPQVEHTILMHGGMSESARKKINEKLRNIPDREDRLIIATGSYLGEGFDDPRLDTLFLVFPISWRGRLVQYAGRIHRMYEGKKEVIIYDYADLNVPVLARMFRRRKSGYKRMGYRFQRKQGRLKD